MPKKLYRFAPDSEKEEKSTGNDKKASKSSYTRKQSPNPPVPLPSPAVSSSKRHYFQQYSHVGNVLSYLEDHVAKSGYQLASPPIVCDPTEKQMYDHHYTLSHTTTEVTKNDKDGNEATDKRKRSASRPYSAPRRLLVKYKNQHALKQDNIVPSVEIKDILSMHYFPEYVSLRESYLAQLKQTASAILDIDVESEKQPLKTRLLLLIQALRQLSVKMVRVYKQTIENEAASQYELWDDFVACLKTVPSTFDFIDTTPFRNYTGLYLTCNPFATLYDLLGEFAVNSSLLSHEALLRISHKPKYDDIVIRTLPKALRFTEDEFDAHQEATLILRKLCSQSSESNTNSGSGDAARQSALTFLLFQPTSMAALEERCAAVEKTSQHNNIRRSFAQWRMRFMIFESVHAYAEQRKARLLQKNFKLFVHAYQQRIGMKALVQNARKQELSKGMRKWKAVYRWWKDDFDVFLANRRHRLAKYYLLEWRRLVKTGDIDLIAVEEENISFALDFQKRGFIETMQKYVSNSTKVVSSKYWQGNSSVRPPWPFSSQNSSKGARTAEASKALANMVNAFNRALLSHHFELWLLATKTAALQALKGVPSVSDDTNSSESPRHRIVRQYSGNVITKWFRMFNLLPGTAAKLHPSAPAPMEKKPSAKLLTSLSFRSAPSFRSIGDEEFEENSLLEASNGSDNASYGYVI